MVIDFVDEVGGGGGERDGVEHKGMNLDLNWRRKVLLVLKKESVNKCMVAFQTAWTKSNENAHSLYTLGNSLWRGVVPFLLCVPQTLTRCPVAHC